MPYEIVFIDTGILVILAINLYLLQRSQNRIAKMLEETKQALISYLKNGQQ